MKSTQPSWQALLAAAPGEAGPAPGALDLAKPARLLADVADIGAEADLAGLDAAAADDELLRAADQQVHVQAEVRWLPSLPKMLDSDRHEGPSMGPCSVISGDMAQRP